MTKLFTALLYASAMAAAFLAFENVWQVVHHRYTHNLTFVLLSGAVAWLLATRFVAARGSVGAKAAGASRDAQGLGGHRRQECTHRLGATQQRPDAAHGLIDFWKGHFQRRLQSLMTNRSDRRPDTPMNSAAAPRCRLTYGNRACGFHQGQSFRARKQAGYSDAVRPFEFSLAVPGKSL